MNKVIAISLALCLSACQTTKMVPQYYCPAPDAAIMVPGKKLQEIQKPQTPKPASAGATTNVSTT